MCNLGGKQSGAILRRMAVVERELPEVDGNPWGATYAGKLTPKIQREICDLIANTGLSVEVVCRAVGIRSQTFYGWLQWGVERKSGMFVDFAASVQQARAVFEQRASDAIAQAGFVGSVTVVEKEIVEISEDGDEQVVKRDVTTTRHPPRVEPLQWLLARRHPERYSEKLVTENTTRLETDGPSKVEITLVETGAMGEVRAPVLTHDDTEADNTETEDSGDASPVDKPEGS